ncbi:uncharacterized protein GGS22DRAFT_14696 [Annulohypoxylon maeteangense]|uniref:uncharacterized protein n=1 Tax=Annulohypoxylon maeteangense TaxID=1927788 RepID=UPI0020073F90|nr:uncharacterized protein GGS22DRAFT_14696 [Annulohypoxylon maeteangense]KAI0890525.1 hypothetical protein GGS22DRAFT_14696 [Annulohypoxylon maeteangense]
MYQFARYYKSSALLMVPQATTVTYFTQNSKARDDYTAADLLEYFSSKCARSGGDDGFLNTLTSLCKLFFPPKGVKSNSRMDIPEPSIVKILDAAIICQSQYLFDLICNNNEANLSPKFFLWVLARLRGSSMLPFTTLISALDRSIFALKTLDEQYSFIMGLNDLSGRLPNELEAHVLGLFDKMVSLCYTSSLCEKDGQVLVWIACRRDYDWLLKTLGPLMYKNCENAAFTLGFCWEFYVKATRNELRVPDSFAWLKTIVKSLVVRLDVNHLVSVGGFRCWQQNQAAHGGKDGNIIPPPPPPPVTSQTLINLCILLLDLNMEEDLRDLARKLTNQSGRIVPFELLNLYIPFAGGLMDVLENRSVSPLDPVLSSLVRTIVVVFWNQYALPGQPIWRGPRCKVYLDPCGCRVCTLMKDNLHNPKLDNWVIKESEKMAQRHIGMVIANCCSRSHISFTSQTNGKGVMTWYIRKVPTEYDKAKSEWDNRMASFRAQLAKFNQRKLLQVLGNEADYFCITGNDPSCFKTPQINATMVAPSTTAQAPPLARTPGHSEAMSQAALLPPGNLRGGTSSHQDLQPLVHDGLPSMTETSQIPIFEDQPSCSLANHGLPQQPPVINAWRSGMPPPAAHPGVPAQIPTLGSVHEQGRMVQMNQQGQIPHSQFPPGRPPLASFHQNLAWSSGPKLGQNGEASAGAGLKRERDDDDLLFLGERPVKK